jgi:hypothetical protein
LAGKNLLLKSDTGLKDFIVVFEPNEVNRPCRARSMVDCDRHILSSPYDSYGKVSRRVLLYFEDTNSANGAIWYSAEPDDARAGDAGTWHNLFGAHCAAIGHFHGGVYVQGKGLYVFTGDTGSSASHSEQASILFCSKDDIHDLIETPALWYHTKWQLGAGDRAAWSGMISTNYILIGNTQDARTVDLVTADSKAGYYIPQRDAGANGNCIIKVNFFDSSSYACGSISYLKANGIQNTGWYGGSSKSGLVYLSTMSCWLTDGFQQNNNAYCEIWCIDPETDKYNIVKQILRQDYDPNRGIEPNDNTGVGLAFGLPEYGGLLFGRLEVAALSSEITDANHLMPAFAGRVIKQKQPSVNMLAANGSFQNGFNGWIVNGTTTYSNCLAFTSGTTRFLSGDIIAGAGGATAVASESATLTSGSWNGSGVGFVRVTNVSGIFASGEALTSAHGAATLSGFNTCEVIDDPTGQIGGKVLRIVQKSTGLPGIPTIYPVLTAAQKQSLEGGYVTFSCKLYIDSSTDNATTVDPQLVAIPNPGSSYWKRAKLRAFYENKWLTLEASTVACVGATSHLYRFFPDYSNLDNNYLLYCVTDFQLVNGAIRNDAIVRIPLNLY